MNTETAFAHNVQNNPNEELSGSALYFFLMIDIHGVRCGIIIIVCDIDGEAVIGTG